MLLLTATTDKLQLTTSAATAIDVVAAFVDISVAEPPVVQDTTGKQLTAISTATTTDIVAAPAASTTRNVKHLTVRNKSTSTSNDVTLIFDANGTDYELIKVTLKPGETLEFIEGVGFYVVGSVVPSRTNLDVTSLNPFTSDTYLTGSSIALPADLKIGSIYRANIAIAKTNAGTAAPVLTVRLGTAQTTADTSRGTFTWGAGTAAADFALLTVYLKFTAVGASAVASGFAALAASLPATGLTNTAVKGIAVTTTAHDISAGTAYIGLSWNGGASAVHTSVGRFAELIPA